MNLVIRQSFITWPIFRGSLRRSAILVKRGKRRSKLPRERRRRGNLYRQVGRIRCRYHPRGAMRIVSRSPRTGNHAAPLLIQCRPSVGPRPARLTPWHCIPQFRLILRWIRFHFPHMLRFHCSSYAVSRHFGYLALELHCHPRRIGAGKFRRPAPPWRSVPIRGLVKERRIPNLRARAIKRLFLG